VKKMPIAGLEYNTNQWDGLGRGAGENGMTIAERREIAAAAAAKAEATRAAAAQAAASPAVAPKPTPIPAPQTVQEIAAPPTAWPSIAPKTSSTVIVNVPKPVPAPAQQMISLGPGKVTGYQFLGVDITGLVVGWNDLIDKLGLKSGKMALGQKYKTDQWDGYRMLSELERGR
jgi:hypothetical protein